MRRANGDWLHWTTRRWHVGFHRYGSNWRWWPSRSRYATCTFYEFWRFYLSINT